VVDQSYISQIESLQNGQLPNFNLEAVEKLCKDYPCFQSAFLLKAVYLKHTDEAKFEEELPGIAVNVLNRAVLYDSVHQKFNQLHFIKEADQEQEQLDDELNDILEKSKILQTEEVSTIDVEPLDEQVDNSDEADNLKALVKEISRKRKEAPIVTKTEKTQLAPTKEKAPKKKTAKKSKAPIKSKKAEPTIQSFTDWLKHKKGVDAKSTVKKVDEARPIEKKSERIPIDMAVAHEAELMMEVKKSNLKLEDFLVNQIERKQNKKEQGQGTFKHAVSETYAQILVSQHKIQEAITIYKELSIKYPKKSSSFARQIENLKNSL
jgi:hypothetical protein